MILQINYLTSLIGINMYGIKLILDDDNELWVMRHESEPESFSTFEQAYDWAIQIGWLNFRVEKLPCV